MLTGSCAGSTAGGFKLSRIVLLIKMAHKEIKRMLHPRSVGSVRFEGKKVDNSVLSSVSTYLVFYVLCFVVIFLALCIEPSNLETDLSAAAACFNNVGPGFEIVGPMGSYASFSPISKIVLSIAMLLGRLEIYPVLFVFSRSAWSRK